MSVPVSPIVRPEEPRDADAVFRLNADAFDGPAEAELVRALAAAKAVTLSLVAELDGAIVGHILFSPVTIEGPTSTTMAIGLAPMAVAPPHQRQGIGSRLVRAGLDELRRLGHTAVVVLGHPDYYPRFGFARASRFGLRWEHDCPDEAFMALELVPGALSGRAGVVRYRPEFSAV